MTNLYRIVIGPRKAWSRRHATAVAPNEVNRNAATGAAGFMCAVSSPDPPPTLFDPDPDPPDDPPVPPTWVRLGISRETWIKSGCPDS